MSTSADGINFNVRLEDLHSYPHELYRNIGELGIIGVGFSEDVKGSGYSALGHVMAANEMCRPNARRLS